VTDEAVSPIPAVTGDMTVRKLVGWIVAEVNLRPILVSHWRAALTATNGAPSCIIADLDDVGQTASSVAVLRNGWCGDVPLIVLGRRFDLMQVATTFEAIEALRKPLNVGKLMAALRETTGETVNFA
jgi:DNA-binding response OmpR family regulator